MSFISQNNPTSSVLVQTWKRQIVGFFLRYYFVHGYLLFAYSSPHISHQTFCLFKNPSFILIAWFLSLSIQFLSFCFKNLLRFRFTMTTSLNHLEFYIFKMNWLHICKWKLVFIICHWQTNGNIIHSLDGNRTKIFDLNFAN